VHGILHGNDHEGRAHTDRGEQIEEQRAQHMAVLAHDDFVMRHPRLDPAGCKTWMPGTGPGMTVN
jgi:hypothetical protein